MLCESSGAVQPGRTTAGKIVPTADTALVFAEDLEEVDVAEFPGAGLGKAGVDGGEHPGQLQGAQCLSRAPVSIVVVMSSPSLAGGGQRRVPW